MLTNKLGLPEPIERAANSAVYSKGEARYSVTELLKPPRVGALQRHYADVIVEDVADHISSLTGRMWHTLFEQAGAPATGAILEERLYADFDGIRISGAMDHTILHGDGTLDDYKTCNVYGVTHGPKQEWIEQLNIYRLLRSMHGQGISSLRIIAYMRDWFIARAMASVAAGDGKYPPHEIAVVDIPVWDLEQTREFVRERIALHVAADEIIADEGPESLTLPLCTDEERWITKGRDWALCSPKRKTAIKLYDSEQEANYARSQTKDSYVEYRPAVRKRCTYWCAVGRAGLCTQWEAEKAAGVNASTDALDTSAFD